jgi:hypothetical protein
MDKLRGSEEPVYDAVDYALRTYPLNPAPENLLSAVMARIQAQQSKPAYLLTWIDIALSLFFVGMLAYIWWLWPIFQYPPNWNERLELQILVWWQYIRQWFLLRPWLGLYSLVLLMGAVLSLMLLKTIWLSLPVKGASKSVLGMSSVEKM